jgi:hypothetical protein
MPRRSSLPFTRGTRVYAPHRVALGGLEPWDCAEHRRDERSREVLRRALRSDRQADSSEIAA